MKLLTISLFATLTFASIANACPDLSGHFKFADEPWNGSIQVEQKDCTKVTITRVRQVAVSKQYPLGVWTEKQILRADGRPYVGYADASLGAGLDESVFQKVTWEQDRLVIRHYAGSMKNCAGKYFYNRGECHVTELALSRETLGYAWTQTGLWWKEGGIYKTDLYALKKSDQSSVQTSTVAAR